MPCAVLLWPSKHPSSYLTSASVRCFPCCSGLASLHSNNIIHRDIKPANIFLCQNDLLKIGDLGIAKALTNVNFARTQIGEPKGHQPNAAHTGVSARLVLAVHWHDA